MTPARILIAGIGNMFLGDDAFGPDVARRLALCAWHPGVVVGDFGIRGLDLMFALNDGYDAAILIDAAPRGGAPGTLYVLDLAAPTPGKRAPTEIDAHRMDPLLVLRTAASLGPVPSHLFLVGCEPTPFEDDAIPADLSPAVQTALGPAVDAVQSLVSRLLILLNATSGPVLNVKPPCTNSRSH